MSRNDLKSNNDKKSEIDELSSRSEIDEKSNKSDEKSENKKSDTDDKKSEKSEKSEDKNDEKTDDINNSYSDFKTDTSIKTDIQEILEEFEIESKEILKRCCGNTNFIYISEICDEEEAKKICFKCENIFCDKCCNKKHLPGNIILLI
jgi:hypothetical protein